MERVRPGETGGRAGPDLATGGGQAAAWLLAAHPGLLVTGADFADLPAERPEAPGVTFVSGAPLEKLPFADNAFDGLISQFGFEYGERTASVREAARILAPGGHGLFLSHHDQSAITQDYEARGRPSSPPWWIATPCGRPAASSTCTGAGLRPPRSPKPRPGCALRSPRLKTRWRTPRPTPKCVATSPIFRRWRPSRLASNRQTPYRGSTRWRR
uniref:Class I SAM-dependent methyltransferase n=1 Tax=Phenylobacterium glaciei TaxID=2803784 RepID=A0A974P6T1_9CAUL|nr:class I SAM-dependent methyltransferase [Phenylobacterium glaciei]